MVVVGDTAVWLPGTEAMHARALGCFAGWLARAGTTMSLTWSVALIASSFLTPFAGMALDKFGLRGLALAATAAFCVSDGPDGRHRVGGRVPAATCCACAAPAPRNPPRIPSVDVGARWWRSSDHPPAACKPACTRAPTRRPRCLG